MAATASDIIGDFERSVWRRDHGAAVQHLLAILLDMNKTGGAISQQRQSLNLPAVFPQQTSAERATRIAAAASELFADPEFELTGRIFGQFLPVHRWLHVLFAASSFGNADHVLNRLGLSGSRQAIGAASSRDLLKLCLLYGQESNLHFEFGALFGRAPDLACALGVGLLSNRLVATPRAYAKREELLKWMTEALDRLERLDALPGEVLIDVWMHSSYAAYRGKHDIKRPLNRLIRRHLARNGHADPELLPAGQGKPTVFVVVEWFHKTHSIMRTHSISLLALKEHYHLVGLGPAGMVDEAGKAAFDEYHELGSYDASFSFVGPVLELAKRHRPAAVYYPSVGMAIHSIILVNLRLAPVQVIALGHPATTLSDKIDHVLVEEDYIGDPTLFSENVVALPKNAIPYMEPWISHPVAARRKPGGAIRIAVPSAVMKINPAFLSVCRAVQEKSPIAVEFHFMMGGDVGFLHDAVEKSIVSQLPGARVHRTVPYADYMAAIAGCDLFANPFPFGNTNGIVDCVYAGLPGICFSGDEVHSHIDDGMFRRMGFPDWAIASDVASYEAGLLRLITEEDMRAAWARDIRDARPDRVLYKGDPEAFARIFTGLVARRSQP